MPQNCTPVPKSGSESGKKTTLCGWLLQKVLANELEAQRGRECARYPQVAMCRSEERDGDDARLTNVSLVWNTQRLSFPSTAVAIRKAVAQR